MFAGRYCLPKLKLEKMTSSCTVRYAFPGSLLFQFADCPCSVLMRFANFAQIEYTERMVIKRRQLDIQTSQFGYQEVPIP